MIEKPALPLFVGMSENLFLGQPKPLILRQVVVEVRRALLMICPATLAEEKRTVRKAPASSRREVFFYFIILFLVSSV